MDGMRGAQRSRSVPKFGRHEEHSRGLSVVEVERSAEALSALDGALVVDEDDVMPRHLMLPTSGPSQSPGPPGRRWCGKNLTKPGVFALDGSAARRVQVVRG
jgi:hypothetical protein